MSVCRDATDLEVLQLWLDEFLDAECTNEVFEVQEQFAFGISAELTRLRTAEKVRGLQSVSCEQKEMPYVHDVSLCEPHIPRVMPPCCMPTVHSRLPLPRCHTPCSLDSQGHAVMWVQVSANTRATAAAVSERTQSAAAVASQQVLHLPQCLARVLNVGIQYC